MSLTSAFLNWVREHQELDDEELKAELKLIPPAHIRGILKPSLKRKFDEMDDEELQDSLKDDWKAKKAFLSELAPLSMRQYNLASTPVSIPPQIKNPSKILK